MIEYIALLAWFGGVVGAIDTGRGFLWCIAWPYYVAKSAAIAAARATQ